MSGSDIQDILGLKGTSTSSDGPITKEQILTSETKKPTPKSQLIKKPQGMHRELWGLLWTDNMDTSPLIPTDTTGADYKKAKAKIGSGKPRPWKWTPFTNPARKDGATFYHWRRVADEGKEYPFARFNKQVDLPVYTEQDYERYLKCDEWTEESTTHLFDLCQRFDLRFVVIHDRWDRERFGEKSVEDLKERYYNVNNALIKARCPPEEQTARLCIYDAPHERKRKKQLEQIFKRTQDEIEEEQYLLTELKKIELRKKEREKKQQDLQKILLSSAAERKRKAPPSTPKSKKFKKDELVAASDATTVIKFPELHQPGAKLRSDLMKLPAVLGQKKCKAIEQLLEDMQVDLNPMPTEEICEAFNKLRQDIAMLYELKMSKQYMEYDLQMLKTQIDGDLSMLSQIDGQVARLNAPYDSCCSSEAKMQEALEAFSGGMMIRKRKTTSDKTPLSKKLKRL